MQTGVHLTSERYGSGEVVRLETVNLECPIEELYENVMFEPYDVAVNEEIDE